MKIYNLSVRNNKYSGEGIRHISVDARSVAEAIKKAQTHIESTKVDDFYGVKNWEIISCELITETV